jgi:hypothetical protein
LLTASVYAQFERWARVSLKQTRAVGSSLRVLTLVREVTALLCGLVVTVFEGASFYEIQR